MTPFESSINQYTSTSGFNITSNNNINHIDNNHNIHNALNINLNSSNNGIIHSTINHHLHHIHHNHIQNYNNNNNINDGVNSYTSNSVITPISPDTIQSKVEIINNDHSVNQLTGQVVEKLFISNNPDIIYQQQQQQQQKNSSNNISGLITSEDGVESLRSSSSSLVSSIDSSSTLLSPRFLNGTNNNYNNNVQPLKTSNNSVDINSNNGLNHSTDGADCNNTQKYLIVNNSLYSSQILINNIQNSSYQNRKHSIDHYIIYPEKNELKTPTKKRFLFIGNIPLHFTTEDFIPYLTGNPVSFKIKENDQNGQSLGYGFAGFNSEADALLCKSNLHQLKMDRYELKVYWAIPISTLYVKNLDIHRLTQDDVLSAFGEYGPLDMKECVFINNYAFIKFHNRCDAEQALNLLNGATLGDKEIKIKWSDSCDQRTSIHITFSPELARVGFHKIVFSKCREFGKINHYNIPKSSNGKYEGFGFVHFKDSQKGEQASEMAIRYFNQNEVDGVKISCSFSKKKVTNPRSKLSPTSQLQHSNNLQQQQNQLSNSIGSIGNVINSQNQNVNSKINNITTKNINHRQQQQPPQPLNSTIGMNGKKRYNQQNINFGPINTNGQINQNGYINGNIQPSPLPSPQMFSPHHGNPNHSSINHQGMLNITKPTTPPPSTPLNGHYSNHHQQQPQQPTLPSLHRSNNGLIVQPSSQGWTSPSTGISTRNNNNNNNRSPPMQHRHNHQQQYNQNPPYHNIYNVNNNQNNGVNSNNNNNLNNHDTEYLNSPLHLKTLTDFSDYNNSSNHHYTHNPQYMHFNNTKTNGHTTTDQHSMMTSPFFTHKNANQQQHQQPLSAQSSAFIPLNNNINGSNHIKNVNDWPNYIYTNTRATNNTSPRSQSASPPTQQQQQQIPESLEIQKQMLQNQIKHLEDTLIVHNQALKSKSQTPPPHQQPTHHIVNNSQNNIVPKVNVNSNTSTMIFPYERYNNNHLKSSSNSSSSSSPPHQLHSTSTNGFLNSSLTSL